MPTALLTIEVEKRSHDHFRDWIPGFDKPEQRLAASIDGSIISLRSFLNHSRLPARAVIQTEIDRVDRLIEQLLTYARPAVMHRAPTDVGELIRHTISLVQPYATQQQVYLAPDLTADLPLLYADSELVHQALVNLLLNAVQATPPAGSVHIRAVADPDTPTIHVSVAATGHGIADADRAHIFDPFFTTRDDGTGLGLSIVQHIVHEHGGTIDVQSEPGQGTRCILHLPLGREDSLSSERYCKGSAE